MRTDTRSAFAVWCVGEGWCPALGKVKCYKTSVDAETAKKKWQEENPESSYEIREVVLPGRFKISDLDVQSRDEDEDEFDRVVKGAILIPGGKHEERPVVARPNTGRLLYTITTVNRRHGTRTVAAFDSFEGAQAHIQENAYFYWEYYYPLAVIEPFYSNLGYGGLVATKYWYKFTYESPEPGRYENTNYSAIEEPEPFRRICGWGWG